MSGYGYSLVRIGMLGLTTLSSIAQAGELPLVLKEGVQQVFVEGVEYGAVGTEAGVVIASLAGEEQDNATARAIYDTTHMAELKNHWAQALTSVNDRVLRTQTLHGAVEGQVPSGAGGEIWVPYDKDASVAHWVFELELGAQTSVIEFGDPTYRNAINGPCSFPSRA
jgi:hypothetical protein